MKVATLILIGVIYYSNYLDYSLKTTNAAECEVRIVAYDLLAAVKNQKIPIEDVLIKTKRSDAKAWNNKGLTNTNGKLGFSLNFDKNGELLYRFWAQRDEYENTIKLLFIGEYVGTVFPIQFFLLKEKDQDELASMIRSDIADENYDEAWNKLSIFKNAYPDYDTVEFARIASSERILKPLMDEKREEGFTAFSSLDVFDLEWADHPRISPDAKWTVYERKTADIMMDRWQSHLWIIENGGKEHKKLTTNDENESNAQWSPDGDRIALTVNTDQGAELHIYWLGTGKTTRITELNHIPSGLSWSPDGEWIAFPMLVKDSTFVEEVKVSVTNQVKKPPGAIWAEPPIVNGATSMKPGFTHLFIIASEGGTARQITKGNPHYYGTPTWTRDSKSLLFSTNVKEDWEYGFLNSEIYVVDVASGKTKALTDRHGPDDRIVLSPDGNYIAYLDYDNNKQIYQVNHLFTMRVDGSDKKKVPLQLSQNISNLNWGKDGNGLYFQYRDKGQTKIGYTDLAGNMQKIVEPLGGTAIADPHSRGSYSLANNGDIVFTNSKSDRPADLALVHRGTNRKRFLTDLNRDLITNRGLGKVEEIWYKSSVDGLDVQGWVVFPPGFRTDQKYPLLVVNSGTLSSGNDESFSLEMHAYASAGYVVFYLNSRGSIGDEEGNISYDNYFNTGSQDALDGVDALIAKKYIDEYQLFVTGINIGGNMTAWMIGKSNRFRAAVVVNPIVNWINYIYYPDNYYGYAYSHYPGQPWRKEGDWKYSPMSISSMSIVNNIQTPTLIIEGHSSGMRMPLTEAEQLFKALKIRKIETALLQVPDAYPFISNRPSQLVSKTEYILAWLERHRYKNK